MSISDIDESDIDDIVEKNKYLGYAYDTDANVVYYFTETLGSGAAGTTFAATTQPGEPPVFAVKDSWYEGRRPRGTENLSSDSHDRPFNRAKVEREWRVNQLIAKRTPTDFLNNYLICATHAFFDEQGTRGCIVFPLVKGLALDAYLEEYFCEKARSQLGRDSTITALIDTRLQLEKTASWKVRHKLADFENANRDALAGFDSFQTRMFYIAGQLIYALDMLHRNRIYHGDIKPGNIIVADTNSNSTLPPDAEQLRLIDFGASCTTYINRDGDLAVLPVIDPIACDENYRGTVTYNDPLSLYAPIAGDSAANYAILKAAFDVYALAKTITQIFNPDLCLQLAQTDTFRVVKKSIYMPDKLYELLQDAVGREIVPSDIRDGYWRKAGVDGYTKLTKTEYRNRLDALRIRPTMPVFRKRFEEILEESGL
jgi:hypothetical protein